MAKKTFILFCEMGLISRARSLCPTLSCLKLSSFQAVLNLFTTVTTPFHFPSLLRSEFKMVYYKLTFWSLYKLINFCSLTASWASQCLSWQQPFLSTTLFGRC